MYALGTLLDILQVASEASVKTLLVVLINYVLCVFGLYYHSHQRVRSKKTRQSFIEVEVKDHLVCCQYDVCASNFPSKLIFWWLVCFLQIYLKQYFAAPGFCFMTGQFGCRDETYCHTMFETSWPCFHDNHGFWEKIACSRPFQNRPNQDVKWWLKETKRTVLVRIDGTKLLSRPKECFLHSPWNNVLTHISTEST